jgi:hypothetical protein
MSLICFSSSISKAFREKFFLSLQLIVFLHVSFLLSIIAFQSFKRGTCSLLVGSGFWFVFFDNDRSVDFFNFVYITPLLLFQGSCYSFLTFHLFASFISTIAFCLSFFIIFSLFWIIFCFYDFFAMVSKLFAFFVFCSLFCAIVGASPNIVALSIMFSHWNFLIFSSPIYSISISCFTMYYVDEPALKNHCVNIPKYSIDVSMDFLLRLSNLAVTNN